VLVVGKSWVLFPMRSLDFSLQPHRVPRIGSASNGNEYQETSSGVKGGRSVRLASPLSISRESQRPLTGIALHFNLQYSHVSHSKAVEWATLFCYAP
jgi:hypothetical protein